MPLGNLLCQHLCSSAALSTKRWWHLSSQSMVSTGLYYKVSLLVFCISKLNILLGIRCWSLLFSRGLDHPHSTMPLLTSEIALLHPNCSVGAALTICAEALPHAKVFICSSMWVSLHCSAWKHFPVYDPALSCAEKMPAVLSAFP